MIKELKKLSESLVVLYVEDEEMVRKQMSQLLGKIFTTIHIATNGKEGLELYKELDGANTIDIVISDISMPVLNGLEMISLIKEVHPQQKTILISAHSDTSNLLKAIEIGSDHFVIKPVATQQLVNVLYKIVTNIQRENEEVLLQRIYFDRLSGLPNRFKLIRDIENGILSTMFLIHIEHIGHLIDTYGYHVTELLIQKLSVDLQTYFDKLGFFELYQLEIGEYAVVHQNLLDEQTIKSFSENILAQFHNTTILIDEIDIDIPININVINVKTKSLLGRPIGISTESKNNINWTKKMKEAIKGNRIVLYYQPIYNYERKKVDKYECLIRLIDMNGTSHSPFYFLDIAKKTKLYSVLTKIVIQKAFEFFANNDLDFSINISAENIGSYSFLVRNNR